MKLNTLCLTVAALSFTALPALAQNINNPECLGTQCGAPKEEGGGCGCGCGCSVWVSYTDDGVTLSYTDDADGDGKSDDHDNCPFSPNRDQADGDGDGVGNSCDNCAAASNFAQLDSDGDGLGDTCDDDIDGDTIANALDNCSTIPNTLQANIDGDAFGDVCDDDDDGDGVLDINDNCPGVSNPQQQDMSGDARCNADSDGDGINDAFDLCPTVSNSNQLDTDNDGVGDVCDNDMDNDGVFNGADNCPLNGNRNQLDDDGDLLGDACDSHYCVVTDASNVEDCLDPLSAFRVSAGGHITLKAGQKFTLPIFANRNGAAIEYTWTVVSRPPGSKAAVTNPEGVVSLSRHWQYAYTEGSVPSFTADMAGDYNIQLQAHLSFPDRAYPDNRDSTSTIVMNSTEGDGSTKSNNCSSVPVDGSLAMLGLGLLGLVRRRR